MEFQEGNIYFTKIIIIQSLPSGERKTGTEIHDDTISRRAWNDPNLITEIIEVESKDELIILLDSIKQETKEKKTLPFIHFETHGTKNGISLKSDEEVTWKEIITILSDINIYSLNNLFVSVSSCWGGNIQFEITIEKPCPFRGFIGPMDQIYPSDLHTTFTIFFNELLITNDFEKAINQLNTHNKSGVKFHHYNSESFFEVVIQNHRNEYDDNLERHDDRIQKITNELWDKSSQVVRDKHITKNNFMIEIMRIEKDVIPHINNSLRNIFLHIKQTNNKQ